VLSLAVPPTMMVFVAMSYSSLLVGFSIVIVGSSPSYVIVSVSCPLNPRLSYTSTTKLFAPVDSGRLFMFQL